MTLPNTGGCSRWNPVPHVHEDNYKGKRYTDMELVEIFLRRKKEAEDSGDCIPYRVADFNNVNKAFMTLWEVTILN